MSGKVQELVTSMVAHGARRATEIEAMTDEELESLAESAGYDIDELDVDPAKVRDFAMGQVIRAMLTPAQLALLAGEPSDEQADIAWQPYPGREIVEALAEHAARRPELES